MFVEKVLELRDMLYPEGGGRRIGESGDVMEEGLLDGLLRDRRGCDEIEAIRQGTPMNSPSFM